MDEETPLLTNEKPKPKNQINTLKCDFLSKLPEKVKKKLDPEAPFHLDVSKTTGLTQGKHQSCLVCKNLFSSIMSPYLCFSLYILICL